MLSKYYLIDRMRVLVVDKNSYRVRIMIQFIYLQTVSRSAMNRRTSQNQRKVRVSKIFRRQPKKKVVEQPKKEVEEASCCLRIQRCGCGN